MANLKTLGVPIAYATILSSSTSTASIAAVDLGPYFSVGKREVKFCVALVSDSTLTTTATVTLLQGSSASTANSTSSLMSTILGIDGSSGVFLSTADTIYAAEWHGFVTSRYIQARYIGSTSTGSKWSVVVFALPVVRNA